MGRYEIAIGKEPSPEDVSLDYRTIETRMANKILDADAEKFGIERENESDEQLRERIISTLYG